MRGQQYSMALHASPSPVRVADMGLYLFTFWQPSYCCTKTVSALLSAILAFMLYPEVQARAQAEVDAVIGHGIRLPDFDDRPQMPYINAVVLEVLRWNPVVPLGTYFRIYRCP